jgi:Ca2+-binding EF-hand superfamily protein
MSALFHQIDRNKTGAIDINDLSSMIKRLVPDITGAQLDSLMKLADKVRVCMQKIVIRCVILVHINRIGEVFLPNKNS